MISSMKRHTETIHWKTLRALNRPQRAQTVAGVLEGDGGRADADRDEAVDEPVAINAGRGVPYHSGLILRARPPSLKTTNHSPCEYIGLR